MSIAETAKEFFGCTDTEVVDEKGRRESSAGVSTCSYSSVKSLGEREAMVALVAPSEDGEVVGVLLFISIKAMQCIIYVDEGTPS